MQLRMSVKRQKKLALLYCYKNYIINFDSLIDELANSNKKNVFVTMYVSYYIACISYHMIIILRPNCVNTFN